MVRTMAFFIFFSSYGYSMPHPGNSLALSQPQLGSIFSGMGFKIKNFPSDWTTTEIAHNSNSQQIDLVKTVTTDQSQPRISFKLDTISKQADLNLYLKKYIKDYNQYGLEVSNIQTRKGSVPNLDNISIDITSKNKKVRSRQYFLKNNEKIVIASCSSDFEELEATLVDCEKVIENFQWTQI